jgi:hypothetical protein
MWFYKYGDGQVLVISTSERQRLIDEAESKCAICGVFTETPHLDHCHETGKIRGILCPSHNTALGKFGDDISLLHRAIAYLQQ